MVEAGRPCEEVLTQLSAVVNALRRTGLLVLSCALTRAALDAVREGRDPGCDIAGFASALARLG
jgi:DNA-binding FrmR family transcriptional regulator